MIAAAMASDTATIGRTTRRFTVKKGKWKTVHSLKLEEV